MQKSKLIMIIFLIELLFAYTLYAHDQHVHKYLAEQGYYLLKMNLGYSIPSMENNLGIISEGAFIEDNEDIVFHYKDYIAFDNALISISHFWDADNGDYTKNYFDVAWHEFTGRIGPYENAYTKLMAYANGGWIYTFSITSQYLRVQKPNGDWLQLWDYTPNNISLYYYSLIDLWKNNRMHTALIGNYKMKNERTGNWEYYDGEVYVTDEFKNQVVWEFLERMCHLLGDMSIPAHAHRDEHGLQTDRYENWVADTKYLSWSYQNSGNYIDPYFYNSSNPLHSLMYITQQTADHFGSSGPYETVGNNDIFGNYSTMEHFFLYGETGNYLPSLGEPMGVVNDYTEESKLINIRDKTLPLVIRATAGLLYWFAKEADLFPKPLTAVNVLGDNILYSEMTGHWYTTLTNGIAPFTYSWEMKFAGNELLASQKVQLSSIIKPNLPPSNYWIPTGTNSPYYSTTQNPNDIRDFYLRCTVTDNTNTTKTSNEFYVIVSPDPPPLGKEIASNNKVQSKLMEEKEIEDNSLGNYPNPFNPTTVIKYSLKEKDKITLIVYDMIGKEVARLVDGIQNEGEHSVSFDGGSLPSGMYIYQLKGTEFILNKKMLLVK